MLVPPVRCWCAEVAEGRRQERRPASTGSTKRHGKSVCVRGARAVVGSAEPPFGGLLGRPRYFPANYGLPVQRSAGPLYSIALGWTGHAVQLPWTRSMHRPLIAGVSMARLGR